MNADVVNQLKFDEHGLIPAILQDHANGEILMFAWMNRESLEKTIQTKLCHYYSRSRKKLWLKGETSGHTQKVHSIQTDCDKDVLLIRIDQAGAACHDGYRTCFYNKLDASDAKWDIVGKPLVDPNTVYKK
ncbi:MAG: phosphoribosyl-AMP cyclohydrolase [Tepidisphaeraceae bacterium]